MRTTEEAPEATGAETPATRAGLAEVGDRTEPSTRRVLSPRQAPSGDDGMATAEYAIVTLAAAGFAGLLAVILRSPEVREAITSIIRGALSG